MALENRKKTHTFTTEPEGFQCRNIPSDEEGTSTSPKPSSRQKDPGQAQHPSGCGCEAPSRSPKDTGICRQRCLGGQPRQRDALVSQQEAQSGEPCALSRSLCHYDPSAPAGMLNAHAKAQAVTPSVPLCGCWLVCFERDARAELSQCHSRAPRQGCPAHWQGA